MDYKDYELKRDKGHFWFKARRNFFRFLAKNAKKGKILNVGTGIGEELPLFEPLGEIHAVDKNEKAVKLIPSKYHPTVGDAENLPYPDESFDTVFALDILEHVPGDKKAVSELRRVLKKKGLMIITVPAYKILWSEHDVAMEHVRRYNSFRPAGFTCLGKGHWNTLLLPPLILWRLLKKKNRKPRPDKVNLPHVIDSLFYCILDSENWLIKKGLSFPFGLTKWGIYRKK
ncbi:class I SAM-dependent methyltransferase [Candidatus Woesearchaeota archaeon]|nr:class I SAM-dependent methyltransferase [Candidatus Woesearchaeota archaeon]